MTLQNILKQEYCKTIAFLTWISVVSGELGSSGMAGGEKKLKNESACTDLVMVRTEPRDLCFCFFFIVLTVTFLPFFQLISQP